MKKLNLSKSFSILFFVLMISAFMWLPTKLNNLNAKTVATCGLLWDVGCEVYYCWAGQSNEINCMPCGSSGC